MKAVEAEETAALRVALGELGFSANEIDEALGQKGPAKDRTRVIITIRGGAVQAVHSTDPDLDVDVLDWDSAAEEEEAAIEADVLRQDTEEMHEISW